MSKHTKSENLLIHMEQIVKRFPGVLALDHVDFKLRAGEIHMLLGENGAGKSTLIKILSGAYTYDSGSIYIGGKKVEINTPQDPLSHGLRFIYQEVNLIPHLDIARNIFLNMEPRRLGFIDKQAMYEKTSFFLEKFHINLDPYALVGDLSVTQQKLVEITKALVADAKILVLDEPTDVLEDQSRFILFDIIRKLKDNHNVGFIYISHRYQEVHDLGDRVTILRDGRQMGVYDICDITLQEMIEKMIGHKVGQQYPVLAPPEEPCVLEVKDIKQGKKLNGISFDVHRGEIVSITGLMGAGKTELARAICGIDTCDGGAVYVEGKQIDVSSPIKAIQNGLAYLSEDRKTLGVVLDHTIRNNYGLPNSKRLSSWGFVKHKTMTEECKHYANRLRIKAPSMETTAEQLSGGNQQKVVIAKWLGTNSKVLLFDEPTRGIDILGKAEVYKLMKELLSTGIGIVILTSDSTEAVEMGHRVLVLYRGTVAKEFLRGECNEETVLRAAIGADT